MASNTSYKGNVTFAGNFTIQSNAPLDDRAVVDTKDKLLLFDEYSYNGMLVVVLSDNSLWILVDKTKKSSLDGWRQVSFSGGGSTVVPGDNISITPSTGAINATGYTQDTVNDIVSIDYDRTLWAKEVSSGSSSTSPAHILSEKADTTKLVEDELVASRLFNELSERVSLSGVSLYEKVVESGISITIPMTEHKCGIYPSLTTYYNNKVVYPDISVLNGNVTVSWNVGISSENPIIIIIVGKV